MTRLLLFFALLLAGCATGPTFTDKPAAKPFVSTVVIEHRMADEATVRGTCYMRNRAAGVRLHEGAPGCSWVENGRAIVLCVAPKSFNDKLALEVCGHEAAHHHEGIDHL
jgi:hypothetical protein